MADKQKVAFIGLGTMGSGMAARLVTSGFDVTVCDVNPSAVDMFVKAGGKGAGSPRVAVEQSKASVLICMVATSIQASSVLFDPDTGALNALPSDATIVLCITAAPKNAEDVRRNLDEAGRNNVNLIDCPVSGGVDRAANGDLSILYSSSRAISSSVRAILEVLGNQLYPVPGKEGSAFALKMVHQILVGVHIVTAVEVVGLALVAGLDLQVLLDEVMDDHAASWLFKQRVPHMMTMHKPPYSSLGIISKDMKSVVSHARLDRYALPLSSTTAEIFRAVLGAGWGSTDDCAMLSLYLLGREGLVPKTSTTTRNGPQNRSISVSLIRDLLTGIHLAVAAEAISFAHHLNLNLPVFLAFVQGAAGASKMFERLASRVREGCAGTVQDLLSEEEDIMIKLELALESAGELQYAMPMSTTALQSFYTCFS